jgi:hypothetical protein
MLPSSLASVSGETREATAVRRLRYRPDSWGFFANPPGTLSLLQASSAWLQFDRGAHGTRRGWLEHEHLDGVLAEGAGAAEEGSDGASREPLDSGDELHFGGALQRIALQVHEFPAAGRNEVDRCLGSSSLHVDEQPWSPRPVRSRVGPLPA